MNFPNPIHNQPLMRRNPLRQSLNSKANFRRSGSDYGNSSDKLVDMNKNQRILNLSGKISEMQLPLPLNIQVLDLSDNFSTNLDFVFRFNLPSLQTLRLNHCDLGSLPDKPPTFSNSLRVFSLEGNHIVNIPDWIFLMPELTEISLYSNEINSISFPLNSHLIKIINLSYNPIVEVTSDSNFNVQLLNLTQTRLNKIPDLYLTSLKTLILSRCCIEGELDYEIFPELASLDVSFNKIDSLSEKFVQSCKNLYSLNLSNNCITQIPESFECPSNITRIDLSNNNLTNLPIPFLKSSTIEHLNLSHNQLRSLEPFKFRQLRYFSLSHNQLTELPDSFDSSSFLTQLHLAFNKLTDLPHSLSACCYLSDLNCTSNLFTHVPRVVFSLGSLKSLVFSGNVLTTIPVSLNALLTLTTFDFSNNNLTSIPSFLSNMNDLKSISFSHNRISKVDIVFPSKLQSLDLSFNCIEDINLNPLPQLINLSLQYNKISKMPNLKDFPSLQFFSIAFNNFSEDVLLEIIQNCTAEFEVFGNMNHVHMPSNSPVHSPSVHPSNHYGIGIASTMGIRPTMEDAFTISSTDTYDLFFIFDGHAGSQASRLLADYLDQTHIDMNNIESSLIQTLDELNENIKKHHINDGSTAAGVFVSYHDRMIYAVGIGDSRVLSVSNDDFTQLTVDQKPLVLSEYKRLKNLGLFISPEGRIDRKLAVSRSFGDFWLSSNGLYVEPEVMKIPIKENDIGIIIACDGLWDVVSNAAATEVLRKAENASDAAVALKNLAIASGSQDNVSVLVVMWNPKSGDEGLSTRHTVQELPPYIDQEDLEPHVLTQVPTKTTRRRR